MHSLGRIVAVSLCLSLSLSLDCILGLLLWSFWFWFWGYAKKDKILKKAKTLTVKGAPAYMYVLYSNDDVVWIHMEYERL